MKKVLEYLLVFVFAFSLASVSADGKIDKAKIPTDLEYICEFDVDGNCDYIDFENVVGKLKLKYFEQSWSSNDLEETGDRTIVQLVINGDYSDEELVARMILMFDELRLYEHYYSSSSTVYFYIVYNNNIYTLDIMVNIILNPDIYEISVHTISNDFFEIELDTGSKTLDYDLVQTYYDDFVTNETYLGYVLPNYK